MRRPASLLICLAVPALLAGQARPTVAEHIALGDSAHAALAPQQALGHYRAALAQDSTNYAALWKAGREAVDIAKQIEGKDDSSKQVRDSLYVVARAYGEAAVRVNPNGAEGTSRSRRPWAACRAPRAARSASALLSSFTTRA